jgi:hypothetical protein
MGLLDDAIREHLELKRRRGADPGEVSRQESDALGAVRRTADGAPDLTDVPATQSPDAEVATAHEPVAEAQAPWQEEHTAIHESPEPAYEPPPIPPAGAIPPAPPAAPPSAPPAYEPPPAPAAYAPPPPPPAPAYEPPAAHDPSPPEPDFDPFPELADEPPIQPPPEPERGSLLSRFMRGRREHAPEPEPPQPPAAHDPPPTRDYGSPAPHAQPPPPHTPPPAHEPDVVPADDEPGGEDLLEETPDFLEETPEHDRLWFEQRPPRDFDFDG